MTVEEHQAYLERAKNYLRTSPDRTRFGHVTDVMPGPHPAPVDSRSNIMKITDVAIGRVFTHKTLCVRQVISLDVSLVLWMLGKPWKLFAKVKDKVVCTMYQNHPVVTDLSSLMNGPADIIFEWLTSCVIGCVREAIIKKMQKTWSEFNVENANQLLETATDMIIDLSARTMSVRLQGASLQYTISLESTSYSSLNPVPRKRKPPTAASGNSSKVAAKPNPANPSRPKVKTGSPRTRKHSQDDAKAIPKRSHTQRRMAA